MWRSGYLMCPECGTVYYANMLAPQIYIDRGGHKMEYICPNYDCYGPELFGIDELMIPAVRKLNELGYRTQFCCSGHHSEDHPSGYIYFKSGCVPATVPAGWEFDKDFPSVIRSRCDSIAWSIQNLEDWVEALEPHE